MSFDFAAALNDRQLAAVRETEGPLLILAGAGSGKTRVITYRIAYLLQKGVPQSDILAVTFTNKAAREMAKRIKHLIPKAGVGGRRARGALSRLSISTFHAFGAQLLREWGKLLGYRERFSIYDAQDQATLLKESAREIGVKAETIDVQAAVQLVSAVKTGRARWTAETRSMKPLFTAYQRNLKLFNAVDFDDLILLPAKILTEFPEARDAYQKRYRYLMVDEFQDTSSAQYELMRRLVGPETNVCVVGDDDQSIYSWRGASYENIERFERDFPSARIVALEQNYRSSGTILQAANALIAHNAARKAKRLWSALPRGDLIEIASAENEREEAELIVQRIRTLMIRESLRYQDFGVLLRANHLTRAIEEAFLAERIPYIVSGGMSFFERQEVRDMLSYLRCVANPDDDTSLLRIVNTPRRGIGKKLLERAFGIADQESCSLSMALGALAAQSDIEERSRSAVAEFLDLLREFRERFLSGKALAATLRDLVAEIDYWGHLVTETKGAKDPDVAKWKFANVESLIGSLADFEEDPEAEGRTLFDFLTRVALASRDKDDDANGGKVSISTIHAAKGLEFPVVFIAAVEQDIIPHVKSGDDPEEERRLFYVALTRAQRRLFLSYCMSRRRMGKPTECFPSSFLEELPADCVSDADANSKELTKEEATRLFEEARRKIFGGSGKAEDA